MLITRYDLAREVFLYVGLAGAATLCTVALASVSFNLRRVSLAAGLVGFWVTGIVWITFGVHFSTAKLVYDTCSESNLLISQLSSNASAVAPAGPLPELWGCAPGSYFDRLDTIVQKAKTMTINDTCISIQSMCYYYNVYCPTISCDDETALYSIFYKVLIDDSGVNRTIYDCAFECEEEFYKDTSTTVLQDLSYIANYTGELEVLSSYVSCRYVLPMLSSLAPYMCGDVIKSHYGVGVANLIVGIFMIALVVLLIMGFKRFLPLEAATPDVPYVKPRSQSNVGLLELTTLPEEEKQVEREEETDEEDEELRVVRRTKPAEAME